MPPLTAYQTKRTLNLGCGKNKSIADALCIDISEQASPDIIHDLNEVPWPLENNTFETIYCIEVIEHLKDIVQTMEQIHRIALPGARVILTTPHYSCANSFTDPTHLHHLGFFSFDYFTGQNQWDFYTGVRFKKVKSRLHF